MKTRNKILIILFIMLSVFIALSKLYLNKETTEVLETVQNLVINEIETEESRSILEQKENASTTEIQSLSEEEEIQLEEQTVENEAFELQGNIAYEGDKAKHWNVELGDYAGLTYYSQVDSRWNNHIYTSIGNNSQTIGSSGCGPTSASMVVSSIKRNNNTRQARRHICRKSDIEVQTAEHIGVLLEL